MEKKITYIESIAYVLEHCDTLPTEVTDRLNDLRESLVKKAHNKSNKPSAKQVENGGYKTLIVDYLNANPGWHNCNTIKKGIPEFDSFASQKISGLLTALVKDGTVQRTEIKKKNYYGTTDLDDVVTETTEE